MISLEAIFSGDIWWTELKSVISRNIGRNMPYLIFSAVYVDGLGAGVLWTQKRQILEPF